MIKYQSSILYHCASLFNLFQCMKGGRRFFVLVCMLGFSYLPALAQKLPGKYEPAYARYVFRDTGKGQTDTIPPANYCEYHYCIFKPPKRGGLQGLIDSSGRVILDAVYQRIAIANTGKNVYFTAVRNGQYILSDRSGKALVEASQNRIFVMRSDQNNDYFFRENKRLTKPLDEFVSGQIIALNRNSGLITETTDTLMVDVFTFNSNNLKTEKYFFKGMLVSPRPSGFKFIRKLNLDTFYTFKNIQMVTRLDPPTVVVKNGSVYEFRDAAKPDMPVLQFNRFRNDRGLHVLYWQGSKAGAVVCNLYDESHYKEYKVVPAHFDSISIVGMEIQLFKDDTLFSCGYADIENWRSKYIVAYKIRANGSLKMLEKPVPAATNGPQEPEDSFQMRDLLPNGFWLGFNYNFNNYGYTPAGPKQVFDDRSFEIGFGNYYFEKSSSWFPSEYFFRGVGIGFEHLIPLTDKRTIDSLTGGQYKQNYLNLRAETGFGFNFLGLHIALHFQAGYASNFTHHYFRPGAGISLGRVQLGFNSLLNLGKEHPRVFQDGIYFRFIYTVNTWVSETYKKPVDWDGPL